MGIIKGKLHRKPALTATPPCTCTAEVHAGCVCKKLNNIRLSR